MNSPETTSSLKRQLLAFGRRFGLTSRSPQRIYDKASRLQLPFERPAIPEDSLWWNSVAPLQRLADLPHDAFSGPVQEDKAAARAMLMNLIASQKREYEQFDLRGINGLYGLPDTPEQWLLRSFEELANSPSCRNIRIISYKDFLRTISQALPRFLSAGPIKLIGASWHGSRLFWKSNQHTKEFACAIAYARLRGLEVNLPAQLSHYSISNDGLNNLRRHYHMLAMPAQVWQDSSFMSLLLDYGLPYARLSLLRLQNAPELLLLPRDSTEANALGAGLREAGAAEMADYLEALQRRSLTF